MSTKKTRYCQNNPKNSYTEKKAKHKPSGYAWCSICSFDDTRNRRYFCRGKDCIEKFCKDLKELGTEMINFKEKEIIPLTNKEIKSYEKQKVCHICEAKFCNDKNKKREYDLYHKVRDHGHYTGKFRGAAKFECLGENTEKYITFSVLLKKENDKKITYELRFIESYRFMSTSLSNLVDNLAGVYDKECKKMHGKKKNCVKL